MYHRRCSDAPKKAAIRKHFAYIRHELELRMHSRRLSLLLASGACLFYLTARADLWCTGYYPGWEQGALPASTIDYAALTHIIHFSIVPNSDGTLNTSDN